MPRPSVPPEPAVIQVNEGMPLQCVFEMKKTMILPLKIMILPLKIMILPVEIMILPLKIMILAFIR